MMNRAILGLFMALAGCMNRPAGPPPGPVTFTIGNPYEAGGEWQYPRDFTSYDVTGLSSVIGDNVPPYTQDNEAYDPNALAAASPVLQLPSIVTVTNLVNGRSVEVRVNARGPDMAGRVITVTPRVARLLDYPVGGVVEVRVTLDGPATAALDGALGAGPKLSAAPVASVTAQSLAPPGGGAAGAVQSLSPAAASQASAGPVQLSGAVTTVAPAPGPLFVQVPGYGSMEDAYREAQRLYGMPTQVMPVNDSSRTLFAVNVGPYRSVAAADAALQELLARGVSDPQIVVR
ncbi:MAG TPA: RlpA-like double-psi beta-barrel domain-containing protein [Acidocella sp.]|uniref:RlpA-like double-psi beta-barrel domain-containing protein n=1 Tax=Acidocella sp. TaxID=50710 RepID=UPI002BCA144F|nr:RlpA-like double-psi beta-barrel domain-containing protein [Acidocella sp.]HVE21141.1 RlpA-like double-psi beta-barrel domain-containing protein [Acidocella sp.]